MLPCPPLRFLVDISGRADVVSVFHLTTVKAFLPRADPPPTREPAPARSGVATLAGGSARPTPGAGDG